MNIKHVGIIIVVIVIVVIASLVAYYAVEGKWPTPWNGDDDVDLTGTWNEEIIITYSDGTTDSLKLLLINRDRPWPLAVHYEGKEIIMIDYIVYATSTQEEDGIQYTTCNVDVTDFIIDAAVSNADDVAVHEEAFTHGIITNFYLDVNNGDEPILAADVVFYPYYAHGVLENQPIGQYTVSFTPGGSVRYRGETPVISDWYTATLPPGRSLVVDNEAEVITLNLILTSEIETS